MTKPEKIMYGILAAVIILLVVMIITLFRATSRGDSSGYKELISAKDETIRAKDQTIAVYSDRNKDLDITIAELQKRDSVFDAKFNQQQINYKKYDAQLKDIPARIARIAGNDDSIRAAFARD